MKIILSILVVVFLVGLFAVVYPDYQRFRFRAAINGAKTLCESYKDGDAFVENEFQIRAGSMDFASSREPQTDGASFRAGDGVFKARKTFFGGSYEAYCIVTALNGRVGSAKSGDIQGR